MFKHLHTELDRLKKRLLHMGAMVEQNLLKALKSVEDRDEDLARAVLQADRDIDSMEVETEEDCLKVLALHQPVARDLRFLIAILKINNDLERIGDLSGNIAERSLALAVQEPVEKRLDIHTMADRARSMLRRALDAFVNVDSALASEVCRHDAKVDEINRENFQRIQEEILRHPHHLEALIHHLSISRYIERIADHATNIAEDVVYMLEGIIVRHQDNPRTPGQA